MSRTWQMWLDPLVAVVWICRKDFHLDEPKCCRHIIVEEQLPRECEAGENKDPSESDKGSTQKLQENEVSQGWKVPTL